MVPLTTKPMPATSCTLQCAALLLYLFIISAPLHAQDDLMKELEKEQENEVQYAGQTFKGSRLVNGQSVETRGKGELELIFSHRFGTLNSGSYNLWGLDDAVMRMGLEYGITNRLGVAIGRSSDDKTFDGYFKYKLARQSSGARNFPFTITTVFSGAVKSSPRSSDNPDLEFMERLAYSAQVLIARKISKTVSVQITPTLVHRNNVSKSTENNDDFALGLAGRYKITRSLTLTTEYYLRTNPHESTPYYNALGFGLDIETGGHVFQLVFTNTLGMTDRIVVAETTGKFGDGDIHFGFNMTRAFYPGKKRGH